ERAFNPVTFTSMTRAEAMRAFAFNVVSPPTWTKQKKQQARDRMSKLMDAAGSLSTQENLWLLLAFKSMLGAEMAPSLHAGHPPAEHTEAPEFCGARGCIAGRHRGSESKSRARRKIFPASAG